MTKTKVNWDYIDAFFLGKFDDLPEGSVTREMIEERYGIKRSAANYRMNRLFDSGEYEPFEFVSNGTVKKAAVPINHSA